MTEGKKLMTFASLKGRDSFERMTCLHLLPIGLKFSTVNRRPLLNQTSRGSGRDISSDQLAVQPELRLFTLKLRMEVSWLMLAIEHANDDSKEGRNYRHTF